MLALMLEVLCCTIPTHMTNLEVTDLEINYVEVFG